MRSASAFRHLPSCSFFLRGPHTHNSGFQLPMLRAKFIRHNVICKLKLTLAWPTSIASPADCSHVFFKTNPDSCFGFFFYTGAFLVYGYCTTQQVCLDGGEWGGQWFRAGYAWLFCKHSDYSFCLCSISVLFVCKMVLHDRSRCDFTITTMPACTYYNVITTETTYYRWLIF